MNYLETHHQLNFSPPMPAGLLIGANKAGRCKCHLGTMAAVVFAEGTEKYPVCSPKLPHKTCPHVLLGSNHGLTAPSREEAAAAHSQDFAATPGKRTFISGVGEEKTCAHIPV